MKARHTYLTTFAVTISGLIALSAITSQSSLKVTAPIPQSPIDNMYVDTNALTLVSTAALGQFVSGTFVHKFELWEQATHGMTLVEIGTATPATSTVSYTVLASLHPGGDYKWRTRAILGDAVGPWSTWTSFRGLSSQKSWSLLYAEDFTTDVYESEHPWVWDGYEQPFDTIMDDAGLWYQNDYGPDWTTALNSFATYRKEFPVGQNGWLTASLSARDWNNDGVIEQPPSLTTEAREDGSVAILHVPDHTGGIIFRPTHQLPSEYRVEYKLKTVDFGGKRDGQLDYNDRHNGYSTEECKTQHPWGEGSRSPGWAGDASAPYCEWQDVREGPRGYNGFHFLSIVDFHDPAPRNNHFWHYHRKVLMDAFSQHPDRIGDGTGGRICNASNNRYYHYKNSSFNTLNMWISGLPNWTPGPAGLASNSQWFMTTCSGGAAEKILSSAAELQPALMPAQYYTFAIERDENGYTLEASGHFARVGQKTFRFYRPFIVGGVPIWHYNNNPQEYDGQFNNDLVQDAAFGETTWPNQWPTDSAYPDYFMIGDPYTNVYEGSASLTDIRLYVPEAP